MAFSALNRTKVQAGARQSYQQNSLPVALGLSSVSRNARSLIKDAETTAMSVLFSPFTKSKTSSMSRGGLQTVSAIRDGEILDRPLRVAVIGGGPSGACAAETLAEAGIETFLIERKLDNCKPCGGAIPICMVDEFKLPMEIIDRKVTKMKMISPSNKEVDVGKTLSDKEWIGMCRREVFDDYLRNRAQKNGAQILNGLMMKLDVPSNRDDPITVHYNDYSEGGKIGVPKSMQVDLVIGADGANSRVAKDIDAGECDYAIAFQERIRIPDDKMKYYEDLAEMYVGDDVSPDFYGWVFPKYDHVAVGTGTVVNKTAIKQYQQATRDRASVKTEGGKIIRVEAHPIPEHPRPKRCQGRVALVGDAAGYVTKCSGEGIYFAAKSGRMCAEAIVEASENGKKMCGEAAIRNYLDKWDNKYWTTYKVLDILQKVFYRSNPAREAFVDLCEDTYVQKMTFDSYLYKTVVPGNPIDDFKLLVRTVSCLLRANALRQGEGLNVTFGSKPNEERVLA
jgi:geranylgeranyl reductase